MSVEEFSQDIYNYFIRVVTHTRDNYTLLVQCIQSINSFNIKPTKLTPETIVTAIIKYNTYNAVKILKYLMNANIINANINMENYYNESPIIAAVNVGNFNAVDVILESIYYCSTNNIFELSKNVPWFEEKLINFQLNKILTVPKINCYNNFICYNDTNNFIYSNGRIKLLNSRLPSCNNFDNVYTGPFIPEYILDKHFNVLPLKFRELSTTIYINGVKHYFKNNA